MGLFSRRRLDATDVADLVKALVPGLGMLPVGATATDLTDRIRATAEAGMSYAQFGPGLPLQPQPIDPRTPQGSIEPRRNEYPVGVNLDISRNRFVPFATLRKTADTVDIVRRCIEVRKAHITSLGWDITLAPSAIKRIMEDDGITRLGEAHAVARKRFQPEMTRLRDWWEQPDRVNGLDFGAWLSMLLEEQLVVDAVTVWPRRNLAGEVMALELIDGATIKPLLDNRGSTPIPPAPAYQQILHGFPRGEWTASLDGVVDQYQRTELVYKPRHRRTWSPYGFSEVEQALSSTDLYLKRIGWIRSEFDDGTVPDLWMRTDLQVGNSPGGLNPQQLAQYEAVINQSLAGQTVERHSIHLLPKGFDPVQMEQFAEKYNPDLDEVIIKLVCMCFSVMPSEVGFTPKSGIGGKGHQEGEANSAYRKDIRPTSTWIQSLLTQLSREFLGMPPELQFSLFGYETEDQLEAEQVSDLRVKSARATINEERARKGQPLYEFPEADIPFIQTSAGAVFLPGALAFGQVIPDRDLAPQAAQATAEAVATKTASAAVEVLKDSDSEPETPNATKAAPVRQPSAVGDEGAKFIKFVAKRAGTNKAWRPFDFAAMAVADADLLNELGRVGDLVAVRRVVGAITREPL